MINLTNETQKFGVATDENCCLKLALSNGGSGQNVKSLLRL